MKALAYNVREVAQMLRCSEASVRRAVKAGELPTVPFAGRRVLIPAAALERRVAEATSFLRPCACGRPTTGERCSECASVAEVSPS